MNQCKKIIKTSGERCSNRAIPGDDYCKIHRKIQLSSTPKKTPGSKTNPGWVAMPVSQGHSPVFPGLAADKRNILIASYCLIRLERKNAKRQPVSVFNSFVRFVSCLSQGTDISESLKIELAPDDVIIKIQPPYLSSELLSEFYDKVADAAGIIGATLFIGQDNAFIRYRDTNAPVGYDVKENPIVQEENLYLVDISGTHTIALKNLSERTLYTDLLIISPLPYQQQDLPNKIFALIKPPLYRMISRYFRAHHLRFRISMFKSPKKNRLMLFDIEAFTEKSGAVIPSFIIFYLTHLPRCTVFTETFSDSERRMLVEWQHRFPCKPENTIAAFPENSLILLSSGLHFPNMCISPVPEWFEGEDLFSVRTTKSIHTKIEPFEKQDDLEFDIPVRLITNSGSTPPVSALILDSYELKWIRHLFYRMPEEYFFDYQVCAGNTYTLIIGQESPIERFPFGIPLRRYRDTQLFIPLLTRITPDLPWNLLTEALNIKEKNYTFLAPNFRLDIPKDAFVPLSKALTAESKRQSIAFEVFPLESSNPLPENLPKFKVRDQNVLTKSPPQHQLFQDIEENAEIEDVPFISEQPIPPDDVSCPFDDEYPEVPDVPFFPDKQDIPEFSSIPDFGESDIPRSSSDSLRIRAEQYRKKKDFLSAAMCYYIEGDAWNAAECYKEAARELRQQIRTDSL